MPRPTLATASPIAARVTPSRQAGGFLVELAIVLLVVGLLLSGVMGGLSQQDLNQRVKRTDERLAEAREALIGFALANGRLPRPAVSATNGAERAACANEAACTGFLPFAALGLPPGDGFDKLLGYSVTPAFANAAFTMGSVPSKIVVSRDAAGTLVFVAGAAGCAAGSGCVPAVIHSFGKERGGTSVDGNALADGSATNADEDANAVASVTFVTRPPTAAPAAAGGEFDDQLAWLPLPLLLGRMVQASRLP